jgi:hypothetical protein
MKKLFRLAAKAAARDDDQPRSRQRRKRGETEGQFRQLVRRIMRRSGLRPQFSKAAGNAGRLAAKSGRALETLIGSAVAGSPWCNPLNGMDFYASDLAGFSDFCPDTDMGIDRNSLEC